MHCCSTNHRCGVLPLVTSEELDDIRRMEVMSLLRKEQENLDRVQERAWLFACARNNGASPESGPKCHHVVSLH
jgi:hypothetical protein